MYTYKHKSSYLKFCNDCNKLKVISYAGMMAIKRGRNSGRCNSCGTKDCIKSPYARKKKATELLSYTQIHKYVNLQWGRPTECEFCGKKNKTKGRSVIHWANLPHTYKIIRADWKTLCPSCHQKYDKQNRKSNDQPYRVL